MTCLSFVTFLPSLKKAMMPGACNYFYCVDDESDRKKMGEKEKYEGTFKKKN